MTPLPDPAPPVRLDTVSPERLEWLWPGYLPLGKLTLLDGDPEAGKSLVTLDLAARLSAGRPWPDGQPAPGPAAALLLNAEDAAADTVRPRLTALGGDLSRLYALPLLAPDKKPVFRLPGRTAPLADALARTGARLLVLDPLTAFLFVFFFSVSSVPLWCPSSSFLRYPMKPPASILTARLALAPDPWQAQVLDSPHPRLLLNCCRQAGKSTTVAALALAQAVFVPGSPVVLLSRTFRQAAELFRTVTEFHRRLGRPLLQHQSAQELTLTHGSRVLCLPCREDTVRGYASVSLLVIDEAARVPDALYRAVRPMLAVSGGRLVLLSTPYGPQGFFHDAWTRGGDDWLRVRVPASQVPRIPREFLEAERRALGDACYRQEYECSFEALEGLVYPEFDDCLIDAWPNPRGRAVGGIDFGFHNPFAALWGVHDADDVLWISGEIYARQQTLDDHLFAYQARAATDPLCPPPENLIWYADPSGPEWIARCRRAGWKVARGFNDIRLGLAAVTARIRSGRLRVLRSGCPNLVAESRLDRYPSDEERAVHGENPVDDHNHALGALRYLVGKLDHTFIARLRRFPAPGAADAPADPLVTPEPVPRAEPEEETPAERWRRLWDSPDAWTVIE